jgi:hypothetical protein
MGRDGLRLIVSQPCHGGHPADAVAHDLKQRSVCEASLQRRLREVGGAGAERHLLPLSGWPVTDGAPTLEEARAVYRTGGRGRLLV